MVTMESELDTVVYSDDNIQAEIWDAIWKRESIRYMDMDSFSVLVKDGIVFLTGHLSKAPNRKLIEDIAHTMPGVIAVDNRLVVDHDLTIQVAQALCTDERTRSFVLPVNCSHGWVHLGGKVPTHELQILAEEIAGQPPFVRGVLSLPKVSTEDTEIVRDATQPRIGAKVYDHNLHEGIVTKVIIEPRNRLVTHAVVGVDDLCDATIVSHNHLIPVDAMELAQKKSITLKQSEPPLNAFPIFIPSNYSPTPKDWLPPYPYGRDDVRWPWETWQQLAD